MRLTASWVVALLSVAGCAVTDREPARATVDGASAHSTCPSPQWTAMSTGTNNSIVAIWGAGPDFVVAVGGNPEVDGEGMALLYDGAKWSAMQLPAATQGLGGVWGTSRTDIYAASSKGEILHYDGVAWKRVKQLSTWWLADVWSSGPDDVFVVGSGDIWHFDGNEWTMMRSMHSPTPEFRGVWGFGPSDVFVVGGRTTMGPFVMHYDGIEWSNMAHEVLQAPYDVWGSAPDDVYVIEGSSLHHYDGVSWKRVEPQLPGEHTYGIWGSGPADIYIAAYQMLMHFDGQTWADITVPLDIKHKTLHAVWGSGPDDVFVGGEQGILLHWGCR